MHVIQPGQTVEMIAQAGGSESWLIRKYNRWQGEPHNNCPMIVPRLQGREDHLGQSPVMLRRGCTQEPWVAMTFDDCPDLNGTTTTRILDTLRQRGVQATFFVIGSWMQKHPELVQQMVADGHEIANHSYSHPFFTSLAPNQMAAQIAETERILFEIAGVPMQPYFRPPYGDYNWQVMQVSVDQGYLPVFWTVDSQDAIPPRKTSEFLVHSLTNSLPPDQMHGAILLSHCTSTSTADALPVVLDRFAQMGLQVRRLSEVFQ
jgi:peptidoglycan/xylan/chitin deacetylase (PgdA/CDA1 family)